MKRLFQLADRLRFWWFVNRIWFRHPLRWLRMVRAETSNGSPQLQAWYQALADATDSLEAISSAIADGDGAEAQRLIKLAHDSLTEHQDQLKGLL
jgi:DNA-binding GntR family transcriptional regulator